MLQKCLEVRAHRCAGERREVRAGDRQLLEAQALPRGEDFLHLIRLAKEHARQPSPFLPQGGDQALPGQAIPGTLHRGNRRGVLDDSPGQPQRRKICLGVDLLERRKAHRGLRGKRGNPGKRSRLQKAVGSEQSPGSHLPHQFRAGRKQGLLELLAYPLRRKALSQRRAADNGRRRLRFYGKPQLGGKAHRPEHPQCVLLKAARGIAHAPKEPGIEIRPAAVEIHQRSILVHGHGVHREIPPGEILREAAHKGHRRRVAAVQVLPVGAVGGDLGLGAVLKHRDGAVADPGGDGLGKECRNLLGQRGGGDIPVVDGTPQQRIPHAAAYIPRLVSRRPQAAENAFRCLFAHGDSFLHLNRI